ncbi:MAG: sensor histidine kinase [Actinomycetota bacterium]
MSDQRSTRTSESVAEECRRLAELLDLDAIVVHAMHDGHRRMASWHANGAPDEPSSFDAATAGAEGWVVVSLEDASVVAGHRTARSSARTESVLRALGPSLTNALWLDERTATEVAEASSSAPSPVGRVLAAVRTVLESTDATVTDLLVALRTSLGADEVFFLVDRGSDVQVLSSPSSDRTRRIPREIRAKVQKLPPVEAVEEATARQLAVVLGATTPFVCAGFCRDDDPSEVVVLGWRTDSGVSPGAVNLIARVAGAARAALETRRRAVDTLLLRERNRWAYEIHDGVTQAVTTSVLELEALTHKIQRDPKEAIETLAVSKTEIRKALSELRGILFELSREKTTPAEEEPLAKYVQDVVRRWRLPAQVTVKGDLHGVPKPLLGAAYVVVRESLANAAKHAGAGNVTVWIGAARDEMTVEVADTGRGFNAGAQRADGETRHFGLQMMRKRIAEVGGSLEIDSAPGRGTRVTARLPIERESGSG